MKKKQFPTNLVQKNCLIIKLSYSYFFIIQVNTKATCVVRSFIWLCPVSFCAHHKEDFKFFVACWFMVNMRCCPFYNCQHYLQLIPVHIKCSHKTARLWHALNFKSATLSHTHSLRKITYKSISLHRCQEISSQTENQGKFFREHMYCFKLLLCKEITEWISNPGDT